MEALALSKKNRIVAWRGGTVAHDCEGRIERKPCSGRGLRLIHSTEMRKRRREVEVRHRIVSVGLDGATQPRHRLLVLANGELGYAYNQQPYVGVGIARTVQAGQIERCPVLRKQRPEHLSGLADL